MVLKTSKGGYKSHLILPLPDHKGKFHLYSNTSKFASESAIYQIQNGKPKLIAYVSETMSEATKTYTITELEFSDLAENIVSFSHLLKKVNFVQ